MGQDVEAPVTSGVTRERSRTDDSAHGRGLHDDHDDRHMNQEEATAAPQNRDVCIVIWQSRVQHKGSEGIVCSLGISATVGSDADCDYALFPYTPCLCQSPFLVLGSAATDNYLSVKYSTGFLATMGSCASKPKEHHARSSKDTIGELTDTFRPEVDGKVTHNLDARGVCRLLHVLA